MVWFALHLSAVFLRHLIALVVWCLPHKFSPVQARGEATPIKRTPWAVQDAVFVGGWLEYAEGTADLWLQTRTPLS